MLKEISRTEDLTRTGWCKVHRGEFQPHGHYDRERLLSVGICGDCDHLLDLWRSRNDPDVVRIHGQHYMVGRSVRFVKGMGGVVVRIRFNDGREVATDNLWHQGEIPAEWRSILADNAVFVELTEGEN